VAVGRNVALLLLAACGVISTTAPTSPPANAATAPVVVILFENHSRSAITASSAPYLTSFAKSGRTFTAYYAVEHPSLPNYLDIVSGSNQGCTSDACPRQTYTADNLFHQLGTNWKSYEESMPSHCDLNSAGKYAVKHNPAAYFTDLIATCPSHDVAYPSVLPSVLPDFTFVTPNLCNDMHDCAVSVGDTWASKHVPAYLTRGAIVVIVFDEGSGSQNVYAAEAGPGIAANSSSATHYTHYSLLAGLEDHYGLGRLAHAQGIGGLPL
jgi:hypothetical protein